jgi:hypothetical protein
MPENNEEDLKKYYSIRIKDAGTAACDFVSAYGTTVSIKV